MLESIPNSWELNLGPLQEQRVLLTSEPSLQSKCFFQGPCSTQDRGLHLPQYEHHEVTGYTLTAALLSSSMSFFGGDLLINMGALLVQAGNLFTFVYLFNVFVRVCHGTTHGKARDNLQESGFSFLHLGSGDSTHVIRLGDKNL